MCEMTHASDAESLRAWLAGQELAGARRREELSAMTAESKLRQLSRLMASASVFDMSRRAEGDSVASELWRTLRERLEDR